MRRNLGLILLAGALLTILGTEPARAGNGYGDGGYGFPGLYNYYVNPYYPSDRRMPYFAEHPPVYYSFPVARPYGLSPYAYPPTYEPPVVVEPLVVPNPHVKAKPSAAEIEDRRAERRRAPEPVVVWNPYVVDRASVARTD